MNMRVLYIAGDAHGSTEPHPQFSLNVLKILPGPGRPWLSWFVTEVDAGP